MKVELPAGAPPQESTLAPDRFSQLAITLFSARLLSGQPDLLSLTGTGESRFFVFNPLRRSIPLQADRAA